MRRDNEAPSGRIERELESEETSGLNRVAPETPTVRVGVSETASCLPGPPGPWSSLLARLKDYGEVSRIYPKCHSIKLTNLPKG